MAHVKKAVNSCTPFMFGVALHQLQDWWSHWNEGYDSGGRAADSARAGVTPGKTSDRFWWLIEDFFRGGHDTSDRFEPSRYDPHPMEEVKQDIQRRNPELSLNGLSDNGLIDLYLRKDAHLDPNWSERIKERDYFGFDPDRHVEGSWRDEEMRIVVRT